MTVKIFLAKGCFYLSGKLPVTSGILPYSQDIGRFGREYSGIVIKSHGNSDAVAFYFAIKYALDLVKKNFKEKIEEALESYYKANNK